MEKEKILFTSESVTEGHPDKMCDAISDAILDAIMKEDPMGRVACETSTTTGLVLVMGEITTSAYVDIQKIVRDTIREIGYTRGKYGFDADTCAVITAIDEQSADIALGVDKALEAKMGEDEIDAIGAGDQGIQFGYASNETEEYMPYAINMAHKLARQLTKIRKDGTLKYLRPDGRIVVNTQEIDPMPVIIGAAQYPENLIEKMEALGIKVDAMDCLSLAEEAGSSKAVNIVLMGRLSKYFDIPVEKWQKAIEECVPAKFVELNHKAFALGRGEE